MTDEAPIHTVDSRRFASYRRGFWAAFVVPLAHGQVRYIDPAHASFIDLDYVPDESTGLVHLPGELLCTVRGPDRDAIVHQNINLWLRFRDVDVAKLVETADLPLPPSALSRYRPRQPGYASVNSSIIEPIIEGSARYRTLEGARSLLYEIRYLFACKKHEGREALVDEEYLWMVGYALGDEEREKGRRGNYARIFIDSDGEYYCVRAEPVHQKDWHAPIVRGGWQGQDYPNWGVPLLNKLRFGPVYYDRVEEARAELDWMVDSFKKALRLSDNKITCEVFQTKPSGRGKEMVRIHIRLGFDPEGSPFLFLEWIPQVERAAKPARPSGVHHDAAVVEQVARSMFDVADDLDAVVARHIAEEIISWEGRGAYKSVAQSGATDLFHFTGWDGGLAILESGSLRMSDLRFMNDMSEVIHGHGVVGNFISQYGSWLLERCGGDDAWASTLLAECDAVLARKAATKPLYAVCLTDNFEAHHQWANYAQKGKGVALGFDRVALSEAGQKAGLSLRRLHYFADRSRAILLGSFKAMLEDKELRKRSAGETGRAVAKHVGALAPFFKHVSFHSEREWRLLLADPARDSRWEVETWDKKSGDLTFPVPYVGLSFGRHLGVEMQTLLRSVVIGPGPDKEERRLIVESVLLRRNFHSTRLSVSEVPLSAF